MSTMRFLCDEHMPRSLVDYVLQCESTLDIRLVGRANAPAKGTRDAELLRIAEAEGWAIVTLDRRTMPGHAADHLAGGRHTWGVFFLMGNLTVKHYGNELILLWATSEAEEWRDQLVDIPL
jgi:hypothetical protein